MRGDARRPNGSSPSGFPSGLDRLDWLSIAALALLAAAIRFHDLGAESLWHDEGTTFQRARLPLSRLIANSVHAGHVPTYFMLMKAWLALGSSEFLLRAPSAFLGAATVPLVYLLGRVAADRRAALFAGLFMALSVFQVDRAQEARSYALLTFCAAVAMLGLIWLVRHPERAGRAAGLWQRTDRAAGAAWLAFALGALGALATHNIAILLLVAGEAVLLLLAVRLWHCRGRLLRNALLAHALILSVWIWWWPVPLRQASAVIEDFWIPPPAPGGILRIVSALYVDADFGILSVGLAPCALIGAWRLRREPLMLGALTALLALPPLATLAFGVVRPLFLAKQFIWTAVPFFVLAGIGVAAIRRRWLLVAALAIVLVEGAAKLDRYFEAQTRRDWRGLTAALVRSAPPAARIFVGPEGFRRVMNYYLDRQGVPAGDIVLEGLPHGSDGAALAEALRSRGTVWLVVNPDTEPAVEALARRLAVVSEVAAEGPIRLYRLEPRGRAAEGNL